MEELKKGDIATCTMDNDKYTFTYECTVDIKFQSKIVKSAIVGKNIYWINGNICSPNLFPVDGVKKADDETIAIYKNALEKYTTDDDIWERIYIKPMDFVMPIVDNSNIGLVTETQGVGGSCSVSWLKVPCTLYNSWWLQEDLIKVNSLTNILTEACKDEDN